MLNLEEVIKFVNSQGPKTTVHIGCDSEKVSRQKGVVDYNPNPNAGSSCVVTQAIGYIKGTCQIEPLVKPNAWAASSAADCFKKLVCAKAPVHERHIS